MLSDSHSFKYKCLGASCIMKEENPACKILFAAILFQVTLFLQVAFSHLACVCYILSLSGFTTCYAGQYMLSSKRTSIGGREN